MTDLLKKNYFLLGTILLGIALRIFMLLQRGSFWFDEIFSVHFSQFSIADIWNYMLYENTPPLYVLLLHFAGKIIPPGEYSVRAISLLFGAASIAGMYFLGKKMFSRRVGSIAAFLTAISSMQIFLSVESRVYIVMFFLGIVSIYLFWDVLEKGRSWAGYAFVSILLTYSHLFAWPVIIAENMVFLLYGRKSGNIKKWIAVQLAVLACFSFWAIPALLLKSGSSVINGWFFESPVRPLLDRWAELLAIGRNGYIFPMALKAGITVLLAFAVLSIKRENGGIAVKPALSPASILCLLLLAFPIPFLFMDSKYFVICSIGLFLLLAKGIEGLQLSRKGSGLVLLLIFLAALAATFSIGPAVNSRWDKTAELISEKAGGAEKIIVARHAYALALRYYYHGDIPIEGFLPLEDKSNDDDLNIIKYNWAYYETEENIKKMADLVDSHHKVVLVYKPLNLSRAEEKWFLSNGWRETGQYGSQEDGPEVLIFEKDQ